MEEIKHVNVHLTMYRFFSKTLTDKKIYRREKIDKI